MKNVLITSEFFGKFSDAGYKILEEAGLNVVDPYGHKFLQEEDILLHCECADAMICDLEKITAKVIESSPRLKIISRRGVGVDSVNLEAAKAHNVQVARTLNVVERPVSELVMGYILEFSRRISKLNATMKSGSWERCECHSLAGKTLGIVGMGKIAAEVLRKALAFDMQVLYYDLYQNESAEAMGAKRVDLNTLLKSSDFVSLHMPLTEKTRGLIGKETLAVMKPTAFLINTARGEIIDEKELVKALQNKQIAGAAIDVFSKEPCTDSPLRNCENCILTPHVGTFTQETFIEMDIVAAKNVVACLTEK